jgi:hypothetical protein
MEISMTESLGRNVMTDCDKIRRGGMHVKDQFEKAMRGSRCMAKLLEHPKKSLVCNKSN